MKEMLLGGLAGLTLGIAARNLRLSDRQQLRAALGFRAPGLMRALLLALGAGTVLTSLLMWLAVIDVDTLALVPLDGGTVLGGLIFGAVLGWSGFAPGTAPAVLGGGLFLEGLCAAAGCAVGAVCLRWVEPLRAALQGWLPAYEGTWFRVTLDRPFLFAGGFLGQGCVGALLLALALCIRAGRPAPEAEETPVPRELSTAPQDVQEETFVASLPGEEPVVVDTGAEEENNDAEKGKK